MSLQRRMKVVDPGMALDTAIKVAFATTSMTTVDQHFGSAESLAIYAVDQERATLIEVAQFGRLAQDGNEDKLGAKVSMLQGCAALYCQAIGTSAVKQLLMHGVQPMRVEAGMPINTLIGQLQEELKSGPSIWLARAIDRQKGPDMSRFDDMESEGWDE